MSEHFFPQDTASIDVPDYGSADDEGKRLSGIFKILGYVLLHVLPGVHVTNARTDTNIWGTVLSCIFGAMDGHLHLLAGFAALNLPSAASKAPVLTTVPKCALRIRKHILYPV